MNKEMPLNQIRRIEHDIGSAIGAARLLLLPLFSYDISCEALSGLVGRRTVNFKTDRYFVVVGGGVGILREGRVPCALDVRRMPPLKRYIEAGFLTRDFRKGPGYPLIELGFNVLVLAYFSAKFCPGDIYSVARCAGLDVERAKWAVAALRTLYPSLLEVYRGVGFEEKLGEAGRLIRREDYWADLYYFVEGGHISAGYRAQRRLRLVRSYAARYAIPPILDLVDFRDAVVADIGCGYGTKGAYGIRRGARSVVLIDIDEGVLRERGNGLLIDKVVADAHLLPLRDRGIDVAILWNVLQFLADEAKAIEEVRRVVRREV
ncbi:MAG: class I SAM-dependent methyltransferase, partial [Thermoproteus sp.]